MKNFFSAILSPITNIFTSWNDGRVRIKEAKISAEVSRYNAQATRWQQAEENEHSWDMEALRQSQFSWKDEWFVILLSLPYIGAFIPVVQEYVITGFTYLKQVPAWYMAAFLCAIAMSFGVRWGVKRFVTGKAK